MIQLWSIVPLEKLIKYRKEFIEIDELRTYKRCRVQLHAQGLVLRDTVQGTEIKTKKQQVCRTGEFLVAEIDAKIGGFGIVPESLDEAIVSSHYFLFEINDALLERRFLDFFIRTPAFRDQVSAQGSTNYAAIRPKDVLGYKIPLPPIQEQRRIVARIEELAGKIGEARGLRSQAVKETGALVASGKNTLFSSEFAERWQSVTLGEVADIRAGVTLGRILKGSTIRLPYVRVANVQDGYLDLKSIKEVEIIESEWEKWQLQPGDILLTEGGDWDKLGRGTVWRGEIPNCIHQNHIFRVRINPNEFDPIYLSALIGSPYGKAYFQSVSKQTTNLATINRRQLNAFVVYKPPVPEQRRIVAYLDDLQAKVDTMKRLREEVIAELDALLPSILDKAFKGEL